MSSYIFKCHYISSFIHRCLIYVLICHPYGEDVKPWAPSKALDIILPVRSESEHLEATFPVFFFFLDLSFMLSTILLATFKHFKTHGMEEENSPGEEDSQKIDVCSSRREERSVEPDVRLCNFCLQISWMQMRWFAWEEVGWLSPWFPPYIEIPADLGQDSDSLVGSTCWALGWASI